MHCKFKNNKGFTFIEIIVGMALMFSLILIIGSIVDSFEIVRKVRFKQDAYLLVSEQLDVLRSSPYADLSDVVDEPFEGILYPKGNFVVSSNTAQSGTKSITSSRHYNSGSTLTAITTPPIGNIATDGTFAAYINIPPTEIDPWQVGLLFRAQDEYNSYALTADNTSITLNRIINGTTTQLFTSPQTLSKNTWYKLELIASGSDFTIELNDILITPSAIIDTTFETGYVGLAAFSNTSVFFDSVSYDSGTQVFSWDFDESRNELDEQAFGWKRMTPYKFPLVSGTYTISDEETNATSPLKNINVTLEWNDGSNQSVQLETYVSETGITK